MAPSTTFPLPKVTYPTRPPTPAPRGYVEPAEPAAIEPWIGMIVFALVVVACILAASYFYKYRTEQNEKHTEELRTQLRETMEREDRPIVKEAPYTLKVDEHLTPQPVIPTAEGTKRSKATSKRRKNR